MTKVAQFMIGLAEASDAFKRLPEAKGGYE